ncbi:DHA2 family efflux MFS transporter permease subunit [Nocardia heshunensis]
MKSERNPWHALFALLVGFFMILLDMTIVAVANPKIMVGLHTDVSQVIWVTSAYLLGYAVLQLITGRLGDRVGPKPVYLAGLALFTAASLWCGLAGSIGELIAARAVQGIGAALVTPQTMAVITRLFPPERRGAAMGLWGSVGGLAMLVGPILGGVLTDHFGWQWIFYINVPVGVLGLGLAAWLLPSLETHPHTFDILGVVLSGIGLTALVFGLQEGNGHDWAAWVWGLIVGGIAVLALFIGWEGITKGEPLVPLSLFADRNFSMASVAIGTTGAAVVAMMLPTFFYLQVVRGYDTTESGLMLAPLALTTGALGVFVGRWSDRVHPRAFPTLGLGLLAVTLFWFGALMTPHTAIWLVLVVFAVMGVANACIWAPLAANATRGLPVHQAGAAAGVYNTTRQVGSVLGSAGMSALLTARLHAHGLAAQAAPGGPLPSKVIEPFSSALSDSMYLPAAAVLIGVLAASLFARPAIANQHGPREKARVGHAGS